MKIKYFLSCFLLIALALSILSGCKIKAPEKPKPHTHTFDEGAVTTAPTHLDNGLMTYTCVGCGESYTDTIEKSKTHTWEYLSVDGEEHKLGCVCGFTLATDRHIFKYGEMLREPTPTVPGEREKNCVLCPYKTTAEVLYQTQDDGNHNDSEEPDEMIKDNAIILGNASAGSVAFTEISDCTLLSEGYRLTRKGEGTLGVEIPLSEGIFVKDSVYRLSFKGRAGSYRTVTASIVDKAGKTLHTYVYKLLPQYTEFSLPFAATASEYAVRLTLDEVAGESILGGVYIATGEDTVQHTYSGYAMLPDPSWQTIDVDYYEDRVDGTMNARDVYVTRDGYILALSSGFRVYRENGTEPILVWHAQRSFGEYRQMDVTEDEKTLVFVARTGGVHIYNIENRESPEYLYHLGSLEMATGLDVQGNYLFVADRSFGISIFDISNPSEPRIVSCINAGECQDVSIHNGYVYCGIWGHKMVRIYDVRDIDNPQHVYDIQLSGRGDGVTLQNNILYAATGHTERNAQAGEPYTSGNGTQDVGYGIGGGMEIWDVGNPYEPKLLSIVRCDGRAYVNSPDIWRVTLSGDYAFLSCSYMGTYVFDVSDPTAPLRVAKINIRADAGTPEYKNLKSKSTFVLPYDTTKKMNGPLIDCDVKDGYLYLVGHSAGLYVIPFDLTGTTHNTETSTVLPGGNEFKYYELDDFAAMGLKNHSLLWTGDQIWAVKEQSGYLYVAAGNGGIYVLDSQMNVLSKTKTQDLCNDIAIVGNTIYTSESVSGVGVYYIDENDPTKITKHKVHPVGTCTQLVAAPGGKFLFVQRGNVAGLIDARNHDELTLYKEFNYSMFYQHEISFVPAANRYLWGYSTISNQGIVIDFGEGGSLDEPVVTLWDDCTIGFNAGGITAVGDYFLVNSGNVYIVDPSDESIYDFTFKDAGSYKVKYKLPQSGSGAPTVIGNYLFIRNRINGTFSVFKWENGNYLVAPKHIMTVDTRGHTTNPIMIGNRVYIPLGFGGLLAFDLD